MMSFEMNDVVFTVREGKRLGPKGKIILVCSNGNFAVEAEDNAGVYFYFQDGTSIDFPFFSVMKENTELN